MSNDNTYEKLLKDNHLSNTNTRKIVFDDLKIHGKSTIGELHKRLKGQLDRVSLYRVVDAFEKAGIIERVNVGWKYKLELSDAFRPHHHHLQCTNCGKLYDIEHDELALIEKSLNLIAKNSRFHLQSHHLELQGVCYTCNKASSYTK